MRDQSANYGKYRGTEHLIKLVQFNLSTMHLFVKTFRFTHSIEEFSASVDPNLPNLCLPRDLLVKK